MYAHSSKTVQDSEIIMTPALYCCTTQAWYHVLSANDYNNISSATTIMCEDIGLVSLLFQRLAQCYFCVHTLY